MRNTNAPPPSVPKKQAPKTADELDKELVSSLDHFDAMAGSRKRQRLAASQELEDREEEGPQLRLRDDSDSDEMDMAEDFAMVRLLDDKPPGSTKKVTTRHYSESPAAKLGKAKNGARAEPKADSKTRGAASSPSKAARKAPSKSAAKGPYRSQANKRVAPPQVGWNGIRRGVT